MSRPEYPSQKEIRRFMNRQFNDDELLAFCFDNFPDVWRNFATGQSKNDKLIRLIEFCTRNSQVDDLLAYLHEDRTNVFPATWMSFVKHPNEEAGSVMSSNEPVRSPRPDRLKNGDTWINPIDGKEFVRVPAGEFLAGKENQPMYLDEFWISKTPVSNAEYKLFIDAHPDYEVPYSTSFMRRLMGENKFCWDKEKRTYPDGKTDHPVVLVSWYDAQAYAKWAEVRLPTEWEWEKSARGTDRRKYPWGDEAPTKQHCNFYSHKKGTTSIGQYSPQGDSPYGCVDMAGNVLEWTQSLIYQDKKAKRVMRGGSWITYGRCTYASFRTSYEPYSRASDHGFRLCRVVAHHRDH